MELRTPEVDEHCIGDVRRPHVVDDLRPFDLRDGLDRLEFDNVAAVEAGEVRSPVRRQGLPVIVDAYAVLADVWDSGFLELDLQRVAIRRLEETVPERAMDFDCAPHDGVCLWIVLQNHAAIIPKEEEVWRRHPPEIKQFKANVDWLDRAEHKPKR